MESTRLHEVKLVDALVACGLAVTPRGEVTAGQARKLIQGNGVSVNGAKVSDVESRLTKDDALYGRSNPSFHLLFSPISWPPATPTPTLASPTPPGRPRY